MEKSNKNKLFKNSIFYSIGTIFSKAVGFFMLPLYTAYLSDASYGIATTITTFSATFSIVLMLSLRAALIRFYNTYEDDDRKKFIGSIILFVIFNSIFIVGLLILFNNLYNSFVFPDINFYPTVLMGVIAMGFEAIYLTYQSVLQAKQDGKKYTLNSMLFLLTHTLFNILFVVVMKMDYDGMVLGLLVSEFVFAIYGVLSLIIKKEIQFSFKFPYLKKSLLYSIPILPHNLANNISTFVSKIILNKEVSYSASGQYSVASQISTVMSLVQSSINLAFRPWFIEKMDQGIEGRKEIKKTSILIFKLYCLASIGISLFSQEIIYILAANEYQESWQLVPFLTLTLVITFVYYSHVQTIMYYVKHSKLAFICSFTGSISNILLAYILVNPLQSFGIALAYLISQIILATITVVISNKIDKVDFGLKKMTVLIILTIGVTMIGLMPTLLQELAAFNWLNIAYKLLISFMALLVLFYTERKVILSTILKFRK